MAKSRRHISQEKLGKHNKRGDLWISIQGKIYDVTDWAKEHPGGEAPLLSLAGQDVTDAFVAYHPGTAWQYLDKFFTGTWVHLGCGALMGIMWIQSGWIGHDSGHYKVMSSKGFNHFAPILSGN
uniref:Cytochrome b5 heme-binding domain-containing protein n=1 Tax=Fagus sylvatica TaxID=28930 RepID=A0A2N9H9Z2_FAGSY